MAARYYPDTYVGRLVDSDTLTAPFGSVSVDRSRGLSGTDWLRSQSDVQAAALDPSGVAPNPFAGRNYDEGVLFSGTGTQADLEGQAQAQRFYEEATRGPEFLAERRELELEKAEREARDPYGLEAYEAKERIRKGTPSIRDSIAQQNQIQQQKDAEKIMQIEAAGKAAGRTPEEIDAAVAKYIKAESVKRAFISGKYGDVARMQDPFGG